MASGKLLEQCLKHSQQHTKHFNNIPIRKTMKSLCIQDIKVPNEENIYYRSKYYGYSNLFYSTNKSK